MFLKKIIKPDIRVRLPRTLAFRLTLWYAGFFTLSSCIAFLLFYLLITTVIRHQTDQDLIKQAGVFSGLLRVEGVSGVKRVAVVEAQASGEKKVFFRFLYANGSIFSSTNISYWQDIEVSPRAIEQLAEGQTHVFETILIPQRRHQVRILYDVIGRGIILQVGQSMESQARFIETFRKLFLLTMAVLIVLAAMIGWFMARRAVSGVESVTRTARRISGGSLSQRVPVSHIGDEIDQLALTFNRMLDRIEKLVSGMKEMSDNIAHDLRSPLTRIRGIAEISLTTGASAGEYEAMAAGTIEECDRLLSMINTMLMISKTEAGLGTLNPQETRLDAMVRDACELFRPAAEDKGLKLIDHISAPCPARLDIPLTQRMIANLIDNAVKYTPAGGRIDISLNCTPPGRTLISVSDTGIGIAPEDLPDIFKRFYRCDQSRSQGGTGLGLSLARTIARAHGGDISVSSTPGVGSTFTVDLPIG